MTLKEILTLTNAGFTKSDIMQLMQTEPAAAPVPEPASAPAPEPASAPMPEPETEPASTPAQTSIPLIRTPDDASQQMFNNLLQQMSQLTQAVYQNNILNSNNSIPAARSAEDITAEIINPKQEVK